MNKGFNTQLGFAVIVLIFFDSYSRSGLRVRVVELSLSLIIVLH